MRAAPPKNPDAPGSVSVGLAILLVLAGAFIVARCSIASGQESAAPAADGGYRHATAGQPPAPTVSARVVLAPTSTRGDRGAPGQLSRVSPAPSLALHVARVAANEDSRPLRPVSDGGTAGELTDDTRGVWQTTLAWSVWQRTTPLRAIRALAPHVTGARRAKLPRHALYASLPARGHARPAGWVDAKHGPWSVYGPNWARFRDNVAAMVSGAAPRVCLSGNPITWGGTMDDHIAERRGLVRLDCGPGVVNSFWALPAERALTIDAATAAGGRTQ